MVGRADGQYQDEQSEVIVGEWMQERDNRDEIVLATKYTTFPLDRADGKYSGIRSNFFGNHKKSLIHSVERSLKKLKVCLRWVYRTFATGVSFIGHDVGEGN